MVLFLYGIIGTCSPIIMKDSEFESEAESEFFCQKFDLCLMMLIFVKIFD